MTIYNNITELIGQTPIVKLNKVRIGVTGTNLALWTRYSGFDPEANTGYGLISSPGAKRAMVP